MLQWGVLMIAQVPALHLHISQPKALGLLNMGTALCQLSKVSEAGTHPWPSSSRFRPLEGRDKRFTSFWNRNCNTCCIFFLLFFFLILHILTSSHLFTTEWCLTRLGITFVLLKKKMWSIGQSDDDSYIYYIYQCNLCCVVFMQSIIQVIQQE